eukprot:5957663-Lingulodinium_polyedra.AAC.1
MDFDSELQEEPEDLAQAPDAQRLLRELKAAACTAQGGMREGLDACSLERLHQQLGSLVEGAERALRAQEQLDGKDSAAKWAAWVEGALAGPASAAHRWSKEP